MEKLINLFLNSNVKHKLTTIIMTITSLGILLTTVITIAIYIAGIKDVTTNEFKLLGDIIGKRLVPALNFANQTAHSNEKAIEFLSELSHKESIILSCVYINDLSLFASYKPSEKISLNCPEHPVAEESSYKDGYLTIYKDIYDYDQKRQGSIYIVSDLRDIKSLLRKNVAAFALLLCIISVGGYFVALRFQSVISMPISKLTDVAQKVSIAGNYDIRAEKFYDDEIGLLTDDFNSMLNEIQNRDKKLKNINEELETKVYERTKELEEANKKLETALEAKSRFLSNMSHEIRTPNHAVMNYSKYAQDAVKLLKQKMNENGDDPASLKKQLDLIERFVGNIVESSNRQGHLLNNILDLSKLGDKNVTFDFKDHNLSEAILAAIKENEILYKDKGLTLQFAKVDDQISAEFDYMRLQQVINNLLGNAVKYSESGTLTIRIFSQENSSLEEPAVGFSIRDEGVGIPPEELGAIFDTFFESSRTRKQSGGTGLGLRICAEIINAHHGKIWAENNPDKGSTFSFLIPITQNKWSKT